MVRLDLGEFVVTRTFKVKDGGEVTTQLRVDAAAGGRMDKPQALLDGFLGTLTFDPLAFTRMKPKEQAAILRALVPLSVDFDQLDALSRRDYETRTDLSRDVKLKRAQLEGMPSEKVEPVDADALVAQVRDAEGRNRQLQEARAGQARQTQEWSDAHATLEKLEAERQPLLDRLNAEQSTLVSGQEAALEQFLEDQKEALKRFRETQDSNRLALDRRRAEQLGGLESRTAETRQKAERLAGLVAAQTQIGPDADISALLQQVQDAQQVNMRAQAWGNRQKLADSVTELEKQVAALTEAMDAREQAKAAALAEAAMPVPGLSFTAEDVLFNGIPLTQASSAEQLRVSCGIAMAANPKLRVLRIQDGSLLDEHGMELLAELAAEKDFQVWIERVSDSGDVGIVIRDGSVVADHQEVAQ
jgi:hypothetical protein